MSQTAWILLVALAFAGILLQIPTSGQAKKQKSGRQNRTLTSKWRCSIEGKTEVDGLVARFMIFGENGTKFPESQKEFDQYCREQHEILKRVSKYKNRCLRSDSRRMASIIHYLLEHQVDAYCHHARSDKTRHWLAATACANAASDGYQDCQRTFVDKLLAVMGVNDSQVKLAQLCCGYFDVLKCMTAKERESAKCSESAMEQNSIYTRGIFGCGITTLCLGYEEHSERCAQFIPRRLEPDDAERYNRSRPLSYFNPLIDILSSL